MEIININTSGSYNVYCGSNAIEKESIFTDFLKSFFNGNEEPKIFIVTDDIVDKLHYKSLIDAISTLDLKFQKIVLKNGESSKNFDEYKNIIDELAKFEIKKNDLVIAFGGGVIGDISGFSASTWLRGVNYIQIPTTLLSMVDSSVGGKCAIDISYGKNLVGTFWQPLAVFTNINYLETLPKKIVSDGMSEVIKSAILKSNELFEHLEQYVFDFDREFVVAETIKIKNFYVSNDERETGLRQMLNLGHTIAHAIEKLSNYTIPHGSAVAIGLDKIAKASVKNKLANLDFYEKLHNLLIKFNLPVETDFKLNEMIDIIKMDKKTHGSKINLIIPHDIGNCDIKTIELSDLNEFL